MTTDPAPLAAATPEEFARAMEMLFVGLGKPIPDDRTCVVWRAVLAPLTGPQLMGAVRAFLVGGDAWPTAGKLLALAQPGQRLEERAGLAWAALRRAVEQTRRRGVLFDDPTLNATCRAMGGWVRLALEADLDDPFLKRDWTATYVLLARHGFPSADAGPLLGTWDLDDRRAGRPARPPLVIPTGLAAMPGQPTVEQLLALAAPAPASASATSAPAARLASALSVR